MRGLKWILAVALAFGTAGLTYASAPAESAAPASGSTESFVAKGKKGGKQGKKKGGKKGKKKGGKKGKKGKTA
jgi:hypothetical protein